MRRKRIPNYLRRCRKARGYTQVQVARLLDLGSSSMISRWEKGVSVPETHNALKMAVLYHTTVDHIFEGLRYALAGELSERAKGALDTEGGQYE